MIFRRSAKKQAGEDRYKLPDYVKKEVLWVTKNYLDLLKQANENNALKAKFISNISAQLNPSLEKLDNRIPEVKALQDFSSHIQTLAALECKTDEPVELEEVQVVPFCEQLLDEMKPALRYENGKTTMEITEEYEKYVPVMDTLDVLLTATEVRDIL